MKKIILLFNFLLISEIAFSMDGNDTLIEVQCNQVEIRHGQLYGGWQYVINSDKEFRRIIGGRSTVDFSKFTLLGVVTASGGCQSPDVSHFVKYSEKSGIYYYELMIRVNGPCERNNFIEIWCTIPKISDSTRVTFKRNETGKFN